MHTFILIQFYINDTTHICVYTLIDTNIHMMSSTMVFPTYVKNVTLFALSNVKLASSSSL